MKFRAKTTTSERQLIVALAESGRHVSHPQLSGWRKEGLLPPLANRGLGPAKGKSYHWNHENIVVQAQCVHDLLARHGRRSVATLVLWLCGYPISLIKVRRAWLQRSKRPKTWQLRNASTIGKPETQAWPYSPARNRADAILLKTVLTLCGSFTAGQRSETEELYETLHRASEALGYTADTTNEVQYRLFNALSVVLSAIEGSSFLTVASEEDMASARRLTAASVRMVQALTAGNAEKACPVELTRLMEILGAPLFLCVLLLQRTGYDNQLCKSLAALEGLQAALIENTLSDRDQLLTLFRSQLAKIWSAPPTPPKNPVPEPMLASGIAGPISSLGLCISFVFGLPARLCANDSAGLLAAIPI